MSNLKTYKELISIPNFIDRFRYLKISGVVGASTFGSDRYLNQIFYRSPEWREIRQYVIVRDEGLDLADPTRPIAGRVYIHHMNPISETDLLNRTDLILNPDYLICCSFNTHQAIHYSDESLLWSEYVERKPGDTIPWR